MALDALSGSAPSSSSIWNFLEGQGMTYDFGTGVEELAHVAQSFGYAGSLPFHNANLDDLIFELEVGRPVVVSLGENGEDQPGHFVTLTGVSLDGDRVSYNDPIAGKVMVSTEEFIRLWGAQGNSGVRVAKEAPMIPDGQMNVTPWVAMVAGLMALVSTTPLVLGRKGLGGKLDPGGASGGSIGKPPYPPPAGYYWARNFITKYKMIWEQDGWNYENRTVPRYEKQRVRVGTTTVYDKIPQYKTVRVQDGWRTVYDRVAQYKTVRYVKYYRTTRQRVKRYRYVRGRRISYYTYETRRTPVYGTKVIFNGYKKVSKRVLNFVNKRVQDGFKVITTEVPKYEWKDVQVGWSTEKVRIPKMVQVRKPDGVEVKWELEKLHDPLDEGPVEVGNEAAAELVPDAGEARSMLTTNPLKIRSDAGMESVVLCYALENAPIYFTGDIKELDGTTWFMIEYQDKYKGIVIGWVSSNYLREMPLAIQNSTIVSNSNNLQNTPSYRWQNLLSPQERADYLAQEIEKFERLVAEIEKLISPSPSTYY
jgi:hypothetical protein